MQFCVTWTQPIVIQEFLNFFKSNSRYTCMARPRWKGVNILQLMATIYSICSWHFLKPSVCISGVLSPALKALSFVTQLSNFIKEFGIEWNEWLRDASADVGSCSVENFTFAISFRLFWQYCKWDGHQLVLWISLFL